MNICPLLYRNAGLSNYDERIRRTCVWSTGDICNPDVPASGSNNQTNSPVVIPTGTNILSNGDFSSGDEYWASTGFDRTYDNREYCLGTKTESIHAENAVLNYQELVQLQSGQRYTLSADIGAEISARPTLAIEAADFSRIHSDVVSVIANSRSVSTTFVARTDYDSAFITFQFGDGKINRYYVDNASLVKGSL